jgi:transglutaminase-like putative cysteine protease
VFYSLRHVTKLSYEAPISESVMEARMQPRSDAQQRSIRFGLTTVPASRVMMYQDQDGNVVHHFDIAGRHSRLVVTAEALVECLPPPVVPEVMPGGWVRLEQLTASGEYWELLNPSPFARPSPLLNEFARSISLTRGDDPLLTLRRLNHTIFERFEYSPHSTRVDSPIDDALRAGRGVCQDFAHIFIALVRQLGVPCRYVSGYLYHEPDSGDRSIEGATHAWVEALLPDAGWVAFDPTNNLEAGDRHIRVAIGRDYSDVPPTRGVFKGRSAVRSELAVAVRVGSVDGLGFGTGDVLPFIPWMSRDAVTITEPPPIPLYQEQQQQQ